MRVVSHASTAPATRQSPAGAEQQEPGPHPLVCRGDRARGLGVIGFGSRYSVNKGRQRDEEQAEDRHEGSATAFSAPRSNR